MAKITHRPEVNLQVAFVVDESEARALEALAGYSIDSFIETFYVKMGRSYLQPYEKGLRTFLASINSVVKPALRQIDEARGVFVGTHKAVRKDP